MSLKTFHVVFITLSLLLAVVLGGGFLLRFASSHAGADGLYGIGWMACGAALLAYGRYFLRKLKTISYL